MALIVEIHNDERLRQEHRNEGASMVTIHRPGRTDRHEHVLVLGGTGKTGRRVAARLAASHHRVRIGSRSGDPRFDWDDPTTWPHAVRGVDAVYVVYYPDLGFPGAAESVAELARVAADNGVRRFVLLSGRGEEGAQASEHAVRAVLPDVTVVRSSWFAQNFSEHFLLEPVLDGAIVLPAGDVAEPFVDVEDLADVVVAALTEPRHAGRTYEVTGPRLLTFADVADELSAATGRSIAYVPVSAEEYAGAAAAHGVPPEEIAPLVDLFSHVLDGRNAHVTTDVDRVLGRPATDFADYARRTSATGVWTPTLEAAHR